jgi:capsular polysaccharide biosynthesis protein
MENDNSQNRASCGYDDGLNLVDLWEVLTRRKKIVISTFVLVVLCAIAFAFLTKPVYESKAVIQVGQISLVGQLEDTSILMERLQGHPFIKKIEARQGKASSIIAITVQAASQAEARQQLQKITDQLLHEHDLKYDTEMASQQQKYASLRQAIDTVQSLTNELSLLIVEMTKKKEFAQATILVLEKINLVKKLGDLDLAAITLDRNITHAGVTYHTRLIAEPKSSATLIKPKPKRIITLSIMLGVILGIVSAFIVESIDKARRQMVDRRSKSK